MTIIFSIDVIKCALIESILMSYNAKTNILSKYVYTHAPFGSNSYMLFRDSNLNFI